MGDKNYCNNERTLENHYNNSKASKQSDSVKASLGADNDLKQKLWKEFEHSGRIEDYLKCKSFFG